MQNHPSKALQLVTGGAGFQKPESDSVARARGCVLET